ncbi:hypothetical protein [Micromonospora sp. Llam0]|uniref:hypothetical protein n=1 Tax=Micromonospora sp. Llam0 TaxID=2485143 RepID=UPI0011CD90AD|nr:hypothetical protein [Micromonospora sp. Llam0]
MATRRLDDRSHGTTFDPLPAGGTHVAAAVSPADVGPGQLRQTELRVYGCAAGDWTQVFATPLDTTACEIAGRPAGRGAGHGRRNDVGGGPLTVGADARRADRVGDPAG